MSIESMGSSAKPAAERPRVPRPRAEAPVSPAEKTRREENAEAVKTAKSLMENLKSIMRRDSSEDVSAEIKKHDLIDRLMTMTPKGTRVLGEPGKNATEKWIYTDVPEGESVPAEYVAFAKSQLGEATFGYAPDPTDSANPEKGIAYTIKKAFENGKVVVKRDNVEDMGLFNVLSDRYHGYEEQGRNFEETYGISRLENPIKQTDVTYRSGVHEGGLAKREFAAFALSEAFGLRAVPPTGLKMKPDGSDLVSLQAHVKVENPKNPPRDLTPEDYGAILKLNPEKLAQELNAKVEHLKTLGVKGDLLEQAEADAYKQVERAKTTKRDIMRIAAFDYLIRAQDRHLGNFLYDPETGHVTGIDHGYSLGLSKTVEVKNAKGEPTKRKIAMDPYLSGPMEIIKTQPDWQLDEEVLAELNEFYNETVEYAKYRENREEYVRQNPDKEAPTGKRYKFITETLRLLYGNEDIAKVEAGLMLQRLRQLAKNGRPPDLRYMDDPYFQEHPEELYTQETLYPNARGFENDIIEPPAPKQETDLDVKQTVRMKK